MTSSVRIFVGDVLQHLRAMDAESVQCVVSSPPYWGLRDYGIEPSVWGGDPACAHEWGGERKNRFKSGGAGASKLGDYGNHLTAEAIEAKVERSSVRASSGTFCPRCGAWRGCLGLEPTYQLYVEHIVEVARELWRVLRADGVMWLNLGDCYATKPCGWDVTKPHDKDNRTFRTKPFSTVGYSANSAKKIRGEFKAADRQSRLEQSGRVHAHGALKNKDLVGIPWRVALALQDDGWYLRRDVIWEKRNPMPESVYDRPTSAHEYLFLLAKSGGTLCWRHRDGRWVYEKPAPDIRWVHRVTRDESPEPPKRRKKDWFRVNLWRGYDYYYDAFAIMEESSPNSHARAERSRSTDHKWADGGPGGSPQSIATGSPVAGRQLPMPAGWATDADGHHGSIHSDGRRQRAAEMRPGKNSRFVVDRVPTKRKLAKHDNPTGPRPKQNDSFDAHLGTADLVAFRNKRSVWSIATEPFKEAHFATFPPALIEPCILAGCPQGGVVLDPFGGAGTTGLVAAQLLRNAVLIEINPKYAVMAETRLKSQLVSVEVVGEVERPVPGHGTPLFTPPPAASEVAA